MAFLSVPDFAALAFFVVACAAYAIVIEWTEHGQSGLNAEMDRYREAWMRQMLARQNRIVDSHITSSLQNGTAFFASTSLIAIGAALTLLRSTDEMLAVFGALPFGITTTRADWEAKTLGLAIIFVYAFFKFAWSYRLFNYVAILLGATPPPEEKDTPAALAHARRTSKLSEEAGRRPARVFPRARLPRLVRQPVGVHGGDGGRADGDVAPAARLAGTPRDRRMIGGQMSEIRCQISDVD